MKSQIIKLCDELKEALIAEWEASQLEVESKTKKCKAHIQTLLAKDAIRDINIF